MSVLAAPRHPEDSGYRAMCVVNHGLMQLGAEFTQSVSSE